MGRFLEAGEDDEAAARLVLTLSFHIPGEPHAQGRPRFRVIRTRDGGQFVNTYDPPESRKWKEYAKGYMRAAMSKAGMGDRLLGGPLCCVITAVFSCPKSDYRKSQPAARRAHAKRPDAENVAKAVMDALTGVVIEDDARIAALGIHKWIGAQGEDPGVLVVVRPFEP